MFSTFIRPESVSQPSSAVLNRFSNLQDSHFSSPTLSLYHNSPLPTPTIASPALPKALSSQLNSPRNVTSRDGRTHAKSKTCHGFGDLLKVPSSPSDLIVSPGSSSPNFGTMVSSPLSTWTLKSPPASFHRRSHTTSTSLSLADIRNQNLVHDPFGTSTQHPGFHHESPPYIHLMTLPDASCDVPHVETPPNMFFNNEVHKKPTVNNLNNIPTVNESVSNLQSPKSNQRGRTKAKNGRNNHIGVRRANANESDPGQGCTPSSDTSVVSVTPGGYARKYACGHKGCGKAFTTSGHLARHNRIHTGEKRYECLMSGCQSRFSRQDNMLQHYRTHLSGKCRRLPSVSSLASSNEGGKSSARSSRDKPEGSSQHAQSNSVHQLESFPECAPEMNYPNMQEQCNDLILEGHPPPLTGDFSLLYDGNASLGHPTPYVFSDYPPFELHAAELTLEGPDGFHAHEMNDYLAHNREFSTASWPFDFDNHSSQQMMTPLESDHESDLTSNAFGNFSSDIQYSLPPLPQDMHAVGESTAYGTNHHVAIPYQLPHCVQPDHGLQHSGFNET